MTIPQYRELRLDPGTYEMYQGFCYHGDGVFNCYVSFSLCEQGSQLLFGLVLPQVYVGVFL